jgi:hypothetical protein
MFVIALAVYLKHLWNPTHFCVYAFELSVVQLENGTALISKELFEKGGYVQVNVLNKMPSKHGRSLARDIQSG